jgi:hypothetical protein
MKNKFCLILLVLTLWVAVAFTEPDSGQQVLRIDISSLFQEGESNASVYLPVIDPETGVDRSVSVGESIRIR